MTLLEQIEKQASVLSPEQLEEVMDFIAFLQHRAGVLPRAERRASLKDHAAFGSWKQRKIDAVQYQHNLRAEWGT
jgi:hypothetical protein